MTEANQTLLKQDIEVFKKFDVKLYEILKRVQADLHEVYSSVEVGPLPAVSAKNLDFSESDLSSVTKAHLPNTIAYRDEENVFTQNQKLQKTAPMIEMTVTGATGKTRIIATADSITFIGSGMTTTTSDGVGTPAAIYLNNGRPMDIVGYISGVLQTLLRLTDVGVLTIGNLASVTSLALNEIGLKNNKFIRATNIAGTDNLKLIGLDNVADLVQLGSKSAGNTNPNGSPAIPTVAAADLPAAGANNNGIILIDKTNHRIIWYDSGNRYFAAGTAF